MEEDIHSPTTRAPPPSLPSQSQPTTVNTVFTNPPPEEDEVPIPPFLAKIRAAHADRVPTSPVAVDEGAPPNALYLPPPAAPDVQEDLVPPENFGAVTQGVYRCGFPKKRNFKFLETLQLKTVLTLVLEDYPEANLEWCQTQDIQFMQFGIPGNKEPFDNIPEDVIASALVAILDRRNHPILIHCNKGKHRTGCLIGCIRRLQSWSLTSIFDEYRRFSAPKSRAVDQQFIDLFDLAPVWEGVLTFGGGLANLPDWPMLALPLPLQALKEQERSQKARKSTREYKDRDRENGTSTNGTNGINGTARIEHVPRAGLITAKGEEDSRVEIAAS